MFHFFNKIYFHTLEEYKEDFWLSQANECEITILASCFPFPALHEPTNPPTIGWFSYLQPLGPINEFDLISMGIKRSESGKQENPSSEISFSVSSSSFFVQNPREKHRMALTPSDQ